MGDLGQRCEAAVAAARHQPIGRAAAPVAPEQLETSVQRVRADPTQDRRIRVTSVDMADPM